MKLRALQDHSIWKTKMITKNRIYDAVIDSNDGFITLIADDGIQHTFSGKMSILFEIVEEPEKKERVHIYITKYSSGDIAIHGKDNTKPLFLNQAEAALLYIELHKYLFK